MNRSIAIAALILMGLTACSSGSAEPAASGKGSAQQAPFELDAPPVETTDVTAVKSYKFEPQVVAVDAGATVTWKNEDDFPHNIHLLDDSDVTHDLPIGDRVDVTFDETGDFYYECSIHPQMRGKVVVR